MPLEVVQSFTSNYLPSASYVLDSVRIDAINDKFVDFIVFKVLERVINQHYQNSRLCMFTLFELFENTFNVVADFNNDLQFLSNDFVVKYRHRRLALLDSIDNFAMKSLNLFKNEQLQAKQTQTAQTFQSTQVDHVTLSGVKNINEVVPEIVNLYEDDQTVDVESSSEHSHFISLFQQHDYIERDSKENAERVTNFKLINTCVRNSRFQSQSLEKIYCYTITMDVDEDRYLLETPLYYDLLGLIFAENSQSFESEFVDLKASYFTEESIYNDNVYPRFVATLDKSAEEFRRSLRFLRKKYFDDCFQSIKNNFMFTWTKIVNRFWSQAIVSNQISPLALETNIINFKDFVDELWIDRMSSEYFKLDVFLQKFLIKFKKNREKFERFK
jgi:hypothetical protein